MEYDDAIAAGALAFFEDKYEDKVRVLFIGDEKTTASIELCGGTHVSNIGDIKIAKIVSEGSVAAGIRRMKVLCNTVAEEYIKEQEELNAKAKAEQEAKEKAKAQAKELKKKQLADAREKLDSILEKAIEENGSQVLVANVSEILGNDLEADVLKDLSNDLKTKLEAKSKSFIIIAAKNGEKCSIISATSEGLDKENPVFHSGNAIKEIAKACGGGGGGRSNFAQAGGKSLMNFDQACRDYLSKLKVA